MIAKLRKCLWLYYQLVIIQLLWVRNFAFKKQNQFTTYLNQYCQKQLVPDRVLPRSFILQFLLIATNPGLWNKICKKLEVQIDNVLKKHQDILSKSLKDYQTSGPWVIQEISRLAPEAVVSNLTKMLIETINSGKTFLFTNSKTLFFP